MARFRIWMYGKGEGGGKGASAVISEKVRSVSPEEATTGERGRSREELNGRRLPRRRQLSLRGNSSSGRNHLAEERKGQGGGGGGWGGGGGGGGGGECRGKRGA